MAMGEFSYTDNVRAAFASCLPCFTTSPSESTSNSPPNAANTSLLSEPRSTSTGAIRPSSSSNDLEHLLRDPDSDGISLHSNLGAAAHRRARRRRRPKFSMTLFGYTLFGRPPIYLADDEEDDPHGMSSRAGEGTNYQFVPDHYAALAAERESERQRLAAEEEARRKAERRAQAAALMSLTDVDTFEGFQGSGMVPTSLSFHQAGHVIPDRPGPDGSNASHSSDVDDADLGGELYARKKKPSGALSGSGSDSRSRTSASFSAGDTSHIQNASTHVTHQFIPYPHTEMHLPAPMRKKPHRSSKRTSNRSTSTAPYTPVESLAETPAVAASPVPQERYLRDGEHADFPSVGLSGKRRPKSFDPRAFLAHQG
ncbi:hypothetical protein EV363DRAFT_1358578 [Boletus edulis]|nr:hypothetical protein EV363DRAFT_1358578 [Boletus edulis]